MSYQVSTRANHVVVGDQVMKDRKFRSVTEVTTEPGDTFNAKATVVKLVFGNGSTIPLYTDDYVTVRRSSTATTPESDRSAVVKVDGKSVVVENDEPDWLDNLHAGDAADDDVEDTFFDDDEVELDDEDEYLQS